MLSPEVPSEKWRAFLTTGIYMSIQKPEHYFDQSRVNRNKNIVEPLSLLRSESKIKIETNNNANKKIIKYLHYRHIFEIKPLVVGCILVARAPHSVTKYSFCYSIQLTIIYYELQAITIIDFYVSYYGFYWKHQITQKCIWYFCSCDKFGMQYAQASRWSNSRLLCYSEIVIMLPTNYLTNR